MKKVKNSISLSFFLSFHSTMHRNLILLLLTLEYIITIALVTADSIVQELTGNSPIGSPLIWTIYFVAAWTAYTVVACSYFNTVYTWIVSTLTWIPEELLLDEVSKKRRRKDGGITSTEKKPKEQKEAKEQKELKQLTQVKSWIDHYKVDYAVISLLIPKLILMPIIILTYALESSTRYYEYLSIYPSLSAPFVFSMMFYVWEAYREEKRLKKKKKRRTDRQIKAEFESMEKSLHRS